MLNIFALLAVLTAVSGFIGYWLVWAGRDDIPLSGAWLKTAAVAGLAVAAFCDSLPKALHFGQFSSFDLIALGLLCSAVGDFALARPGPRAFLCGLSAFALAHLGYATALTLRSRAMIDGDILYDNAHRFAGGAIGFGQIAALIGLAALLLSTELWLTPRTAALRWPVRLYVLLIGAMAASMILLLNSAGATLLRLGAVLFIASDVMLALRLFVISTPLWRNRLALALWPAYWLGQALILMGASIYWLHPKG